MRIRSIKPEFWRSSDISALSVEDRLLFIGLWSYVDDNGVGVDKLSAVTADLFADDLERDPSETFARVSRGLQNLAEAGRIIRYSLEKYDYLEIVNWTKHQRIDKPNKPRLPQHNAEGVAIREGVAKDSRDSRESPAPGTEEQGNRGTEEQSSSSHVASDDDDQQTEEEFPDEVHQLCNHLADWITRNGNREPKITKTWLQAMDRLIRIDEYTPGQIADVITWCQQDEFWQANILSAPKLRKQFDQLKMKMFQERNRPAQTPHMTASHRRLQEGYEREQRILSGELDFNNTDNPYLQPRPARAIEGGNTWTPEQQ